MVRLIMTPIFRFAGLMVPGILYVTLCFRTTYVGSLLNTNYDPIMKKRTTTMIVALTLCVCASAPITANAETDARAERARSFYKIGLIAVDEGNFNLAKQSFREVLKLYPTHPQARRQLIHITTNRNTLEIGRRKATLKKVIIPQVNLEKETLQEALQMLTSQVERESQKKIRPNFIIQDPTGGFNGRSITLRLNRVPAETLLRYIVDQARGNIRYDNHAIVITPRHKGKAAEPKGEDGLIVK